MGKASQLKQVERATLSRVSKGRQAAFERFPLLFTLLGTFGVVATFYGFEGLIDDISFLSDNPIILLLTGILVLGFTGELYKRLR